MNTFKLAFVALAFSCILPAQGFTGSFPLNTTGGFPVGLDDNGGGNLLFTDTGTADEIGLSDTTGTILFNVDVSANSSFPLGITTDGTTNIWVTDTGGDDVDLYDGVGSYISSFSVAAFTTAPEGVAYSPVTGNLYVTDGFTAQALEFTPAGTFVAAFSLNGSSVDGIAHDPSDDTFWIYDSGTDSIRHYDANFVELSAVPGTVANGLSSGEGVAVIGTDIYVCASGSDAVAVFSTAVTAEAVEFGSGCPAPDDFYELFAPGANDLSGTSFTITPNTGGFSVTNAGSFDGSFTNNLSSGDDSLFTGQNLGFTANFPGLGTTSTIDIDSNGRIGVGLTRSDFTQSVAEFVGQTTVAVCWDDLNPNGGGALYFDTAPGFAMVTWDQVPQFGSTDSNTFQVKLYDDGRIECNYLALANDPLVGLSDGVSPQDLEAIDLSASVPFSLSTTGSGLPLTLSALSRPILGQSFDLSTANIPVTALGGGVIFGSSQLSISGLGLPDGCTILSNGDITTLPLNLGTGDSALLLATDPSILGLQLYAQTAVIDLTLGVPIPILLSNGVEFTIGFP